MTNPIFRLIVSIAICSLAHAFIAPARTPSSQRGGVAPGDDAPVPPLFVARGDAAVGLTLYPVISRIASKNWTGSCKYVGADLVHLSKLKLTGGVRYDVEGRNVTLSSYLTFPDGNTREVVMTGSKDSTSPSPNVLTLRSINEGGGPIRMLLSEVGSDTILVNEVEEATGRVILTSSTSIVAGAGGKEELVQVSHEVGGEAAGIEGHQIWRLTAAPPYVERLAATAKEADASGSGGDPVDFDDFEDFRLATGQ
mmetsp:Transcript_28542/g.60501  ORF Transcript_28542/g.60501 Transcript_28542/m.60501 type:complete len:253 (-) Transcript_28542:164-922(-)